VADDLSRSLAETGGALERDEHVSAVLRLRRACAVGVVAWPAFTLVDWFIVTFVHPGRLWFYLLLRAIGLLPLLIAVVLVYGRRLPSPIAVRWVEAGGATILSALVSLSSIDFGGITSPLVLGVVIILLARAAIIADRWQRAILPIGLVTIAHPITLALCAPFDPQIAAQFQDGTALANFTLNEMFLFAAASLTLVGGHMIWSLRRQVFETRSLGRYRLKQRIGAGGMGEVWAAHHHALRRDVAVKILRPETRGDPAAIARFEREVRATAELVHPNTVRVFDYGITEDGLWYYAMELLDGRDLFAIVSREGPMEPTRAARLMWQAAKAVGEAHARGIVHRDLKPENLFVTAIGGEGEFIKVLDFGLAKVARGERHATSQAALTGEGWAVGTPKWASPEVVSGNEADTRSDVYGLGTVLYYLLTGAPPFDYPDLGKILLAHVREEVTPPSRRVGRAIPPAIESVTLRCMAKDPAQRYPSAGELAAALEEALGGAPVSGVRAVGSHAWPGNPAAREGAHGVIPRDPVSRSGGDLSGGEDSVSDVTKVRPRRNSPPPIVEPPPGVPFRRSS